MPAACDRRSRICGLRTAGAQGQGAQGRGKGIYLLEDQVPGWAVKGIHIPDKDHTLGVHKVAIRLRGARPKCSELSNALARARGTPRRDTSHTAGFQQNKGVMPWPEEPGSWIRTSSS